MECNEVVGILLRGLVLPTLRIFGEKKLIFEGYLTTVWNLRKFLSHNFGKKNRESNGFAKEITKELISRKKNFSEREFLGFPHCEFSTLWISAECVKDKNFVKSKYSVIDLV